MNVRGFLKYGALAVTLAVIVTVLILSGQKNSAACKEITCGDIKVEFKNSERLNFVTESNIKQYITKGYKICSGMRLEEIDLAQIESVLDSKSAILKSEAYTTRDGVLHIQIYQREPVVRLISDSGRWYVDETGYIFAMQKNYSSRVPVIDGVIPLEIGNDFKGIPEKKKDREWLNGILELVEFLADNRKWNDSVAQIHVNANGHLVIVPRKGREKFHIGRPEQFERKFAKIEDYYRFIVPEKGEKAYSYVNVSFDGQIVCRK